MEPFLSVPHALLALLSEGPKYGLQLRQEFEARTGEVWPLNVGQVYTTLQRLERDGLVESDDGGGERPAEAATGSPPTGDARAGRLAADPARLVAAAARRAGDQGAGRAAGARGRRARDPAGPPPSPHRDDAALHAGQGSAPARTTSALLLVADAELFRLEAIVRWLDAADVRLKQPRRSRRAGGRGHVPPTRSHPMEVSP